MQIKQTKWLFAIVGAIAILNCTPTIAATDTWTGGSDTFWSNLDNWQPDLPSISDLLFFNRTVPIKSISNRIEALTINRIKFNSDHNASSYSIAGNTIKFGPAVQDV